jgi:FkbM family methyltransferase
MLVRKVLKLLANVLRSLLGVNGVAANLNVVRSDIGGLGSALRELRDQIDIIRLRVESPAEAPSEGVDLPVSPTERFVEVKLPSGQTYHLSTSTAGRDLYHDLVASGDAYDSNWRFLNAWLKPGDVFFDLGANIGTISIPAAVNGAAVHAFELLNANVQHLARSVEKNDLKTVHIVNGALSDTHEFPGIGGHSAWGSLESDALVSIPTIVIDHYVKSRNIHAVATMKLDIEGSELRALKGAVSLIERDHPDIVVECNAWCCGSYDYSFRDILAYLETSGYRLYRLLDKGLSPARPHSPQELFFVDYLASTKDTTEIARKSGWPIVELDHETMVDNIINNERFGVVHKQYVMAVKDMLPGTLLADPRVAAALENWRQYEDPAVTLVYRKGSGLPHS